MAEKEATVKLGLLKEQDVALKLGKQDLDLDKAEEKADAKFVQDSDDEDFVNLDSREMYHEAAEDADDEIDTDDDFEEIPPLNIKKVKTSNVSNPVHLSTNHPEQTTQTTAHTHHRVEWADSLAQAQTESAEASHTAPIASEYKLPRAPTPYPEPLAVHKFPDHLHPSPPLRRRKGSMALRKKTSESATAHSMMPKTEENQGALYGHHQDHVAESSYSSNTYTTPTHRGKMAEARGNQNASSGEDQGNAAEIDQSSEAATSTDFPFLKHKPSGLSKAYAEVGHGEEDTATATKSMMDLVKSPKASNEKKSLRNLFKRKGSKEPTTPPSSSSGNTADRKTISAPTLVSASPNAKALLQSASPLLQNSPNAKKVVNYSRPTVPQSSSNVSSGSPVGRGLSSSGMSPSTSREGDGESFNPSDYSGDENSVKQVVAVSMVADWRANLVQSGPHHATNTAALGNRSGLGIGVPFGKSKMTDQEAEALGAQDADRYIANAQIGPMAANTDDPFVDAAFQSLVAKPANEISAREMARLKAAREAGDMGNGMVDWMNALHAKSDAEPGDGNTEGATSDTRTKTGEKFVSKVRGLGKKSKKGKEPEESKDEVVRKVEAEKENGLREEKAMNEMLKGKLAAKDAANGGVRGAGMPRIDYGPPTQRTALGGSVATDEERAHAGALATRRAHGDNTTARGHFEGYSPK